jgi:uncharacterized protein YrrD
VNGSPNWSEKSPILNDHCPQAGMEQPVHVHRQARYSMSRRKDTMNSARDVVGKPIVTPSGTPVNTIADVIFDPHTHYVLCFIIEPGGWVGGAKILPWSDDYSITPNALTLSSPEQIVLARKVPHIQEILENIQVVVGQKIVAADGRQLGILDDVFFNQNTGEIHEYEIGAPSPKLDFEQKATLEPEEVDFLQGDNGVLLVSAATTDLIKKQIRNE